jgi:hypothetical protein
VFAVRVQLAVCAKDKNALSQAKSAVVIVSQVHVQEDIDAPQANHQGVHQLIVQSARLLKYCQSVGAVAGKV